MKSRIVKIGMALTLATLTASAGNLIDNGDFSKADSSGRVTGFVQQAANAQYSAPALMVKKEGDISVLQISLGEKEKTRFRPAEVRIPFLKDTAYKFSLRVRGRGKFMLVVKTNPENAGEVDLAPEWTSVSADWQDFSTVWTPSCSGTVSLQLQVMGSVDVDEWFFGVTE